MPRDNKVNKPKLPKMEPVEPKGGSKVSFPVWFNPMFNKIDNKDLHKK